MTDELDTTLPAVQAATKEDLDRRIVRLAAELFADGAEDDSWAPVPITAAEFVRRMRPFMVYN